MEAQKRERQVALTPQLLDRVSPRFERQLSDSITLMPHQQAALLRCMQIESLPPVSYKNDTFRVGIMGDRPACGKTFTTLALIAAGRAGGDEGINLVVVPQAILTQWRDALETFGGGLRYKLLNEYQDISGLYFNRQVLLEHDVLVTTSMYYKIIVDVARGIKLRLRRMFVDEVDGASWSVSGDANADVTWYISATFADACGSHGYVGQLLTNVPSEQVRERVCMCTDDFIDESIYLPEPEFKQVDCLNKHLDRLLTAFLTEATLRCLNAGNYSAIKNKFHPVSAKNEQQVVGIIMYNASETVKQAQIRLKDAGVRVSQENIRAFEAAVEDAKLVEREVRRVTQVHNLCLLCFGFISEWQSTSPCCCHSFCPRCIDEHLHRHDDCPACYEKLAREDLLVDAVEDEGAEHGGLSSKLDAVAQIVADTEGDKVLVFSEHADCFDDLEYRLSGMGTVLHLNGGDVASIDKIITAYKRPGKKILLVCSDHFGRGLNLEMTSDIVFLHKMSSSLTQQVVGRAQRYGRTTKLRVWDVLYENERINSRLTPPAEGA